MPATDEKPMPVEVTVKNWTDNPAKPPMVRSSTTNTYILTTDGSFDGKSFQLTDFEPSRLRMLIIPIDAAIALNVNNPNTAPDTSSASAKASGAVLPVTTVGYEVFGPDAYWLVNLGTNTRVTVIKEYGA